MKKAKVIIVFGTRPEAIKMIPIIIELKKQAERFELITVITAQHREMLDQVLNTFNVTPDYDLNIMEPNQSLAQITSRVLINIEPILKQEMPDIVLVHGDTTTTLAASLGAFYHKIKIGHVEAGLRTWNKYSPFPEEMNRQITDVLSDIYFAPTTQSADNLLTEGHTSSEVLVTGNTVIDLLKYTISANYEHPVLNEIEKNHKIVILTMHRRENQGRPMENVFQAVRDVVQGNSNIEVIYPVHMNPNVQKLAKSILGDIPRIHLVEPLDVIDFHNLADKSYFIMTDSGGVQEEAPSLGKPVLVLRDTTERPEGVQAGTLKLIGTEYQDVVEGMNVLLNDGYLYNQMSHAKNPYGDGNAALRILEFIHQVTNK